MNRVSAFRAVGTVVLMTALTLAGCVTPAQFLDSKQSMAVKTAVTRAQFEMSYPTATGEMLSREVIQPAIQGPWVGGVQRAEYTVGARGATRSWC